MEQERRARTEAVRPAPMDNVRVLPSLPYGAWLWSEMCALYEAGATVPVTTNFERVVVLDRRAVGRGDVATVVDTEWCSDTILECAQRAAPPVPDVEMEAQEWIPKLESTDTSQDGGNDGVNVAADARCLDAKMHFRRQYRDLHVVAKDQNEIKLADWRIEAPDRRCGSRDTWADSGRGGPESYHKEWARDGQNSACMTGRRVSTLQNSSLRPTRELDLTNLAVIEAIARRVELIEYQYRKRTREGLRIASLGTHSKCHRLGREVKLCDKEDMKDQGC